MLIVAGIVILALILLIIGTQPDQDFGDTKKTQKAEFEAWKKKHR